jgi:hypothetical protein
MSTAPARMNMGRRRVPLCGLTIMRIKVRTLASNTRHPSRRRDHRCQLDAYLAGTATDIQHCSARSKPQHLVSRATVICQMLCREPQVIDEIPGVTARVDV